MVDNLFEYFSISLPVLWVCIIKNPDNYRHQNYTYANEDKYLLNNLAHLKLNGQQTLFQKNSQEKLFYQPALIIAKLINLRQ
jgi:hypothetical protein